MSVYRHPKSQFWLYDFKRGGRRFCGTFDGQKGRPRITADRNKREAERAEALIRAAVDQPRSEQAGITLHDACVRYWNEAAKDFAGASGEWGRLRNLERLLGKHTALHAIDGAAIARYVARRRGEYARNKDTVVSAATVNRELECLGRINKRAHKQWKVQAMDVDLSDYKLAEPTVRIRSLTTDEEAALWRAVDKIRPDFRDMIEFALLTGKRLSEVILLEKRRIDRKAMEARVIQKGGQEIAITLTATTLAIVERNWMHHPIRLFTYVCRQSRWFGNTQPLKHPKLQKPAKRMGRRYPFTKDGWRKYWRAILDEAKIEDFRFHDLRHTLATRVLAATGNLRAVQDALSHASIVSSARYAHTDNRQRRAALEAAERQRIPDDSRTDESKKSESGNGSIS